ncbi:MAG: UDP-N-acetylmuramoylalanine--D-glutamate ligase [Candidatus Levybacteria bacterium RIFCSPHIGHO2_02_FULL_40_18]|nr:MAG: UDP-N-acetylmuramoylalanine--D-glutamate ligase [Candidatus Levybacteria bacterium RIFCSPHIGHO2_01_FULL_40_58]OGH26133.1 MAG: UDP-N-acetylmuramoylalanine--D-glutamate ligase [Candidatus Levybacteria bacterium RIFCSPHIGHO2_02_FULL_40_18]OGH31319.1 MAG: UDP-N-acetylmuramoylalanine--D-glutamate ligase [Candidatus Levybacteria bacterium RIFCSPHIGHO2_12_FULL_40_31]OGH39962.1 MAG: UDP-N-acetylmuramoylalanine--D-glutamate ligase [Candidatus Levybacteria bacterium RIFCSPLOWO2_01_FULL_40_64]OGH4
MKKEDFKNKNVVILGFGLEGESTTNFLLENGAKAFVVDVRSRDKFEEEKISDFENKGVSFMFDSYPRTFENFDLVVRSPGIRLSSNVIEKAKSEGKEITSSTKIFFDLCPCKIIGVTGTKGKSTTATLIYEMLKSGGIDAYLGGNVGKPPLDFLNDLKIDSKVVLELSSFQLQDLNKSPQIAVFLMVTSEHLDYHRDINEYIEAKRNILRYQGPDDFAILNKDYPASNESDVHTHGQLYCVSREQQVEQGCFVRDGYIWLKIGTREEQIMPTSEVLLAGKHNLENVCAAILAATIAGAHAQTIITVLKNFKGLEHRLEFVGEHHGIKFYNDSLATIPEAVIEGIEALGEDVETLIAGGYDRDLDYRELGKYLSDSKIRTLILFPATGEKIWESLCVEVPNESLRPKKFDVASMKEAVLTAYEHTNPGKICLMSPGAASFNMFKNYKERGEQFKKEVENLSSS